MILIRAPMPDLRAPALALLLLAAPALAEIPESVKPYGPRAVLLPGDAACEARIAVWNLSGRYTGEETLTSARGPVTIRYETVGGHVAGDDDRVEVTGLPDGLSAAPMFADVADGAVLEICLFEYRGG